MATQMAKQTLHLESKEIAYLLAQQHIGYSPRRPPRDFFRSTIKIEPVLEYFRIISSLADGFDLAWNRPDLFFVYKKIHFKPFKTFFITFLHIFFK